MKRLIIAAVTCLAFTVFTYQFCFAGSDLSVRPLDGRIVPPGLNPSSTTITSTDRTVIDYQSFSIANGNTVDIHNVTEGGGILSRVTGNDSSQIAGNIQSSGILIPLNPEISSNSTFDQPAYNFASLTVNPNVTLTISGDVTINVDTDVTVNGSIALSSGSRLTINCVNFTDNGTVTTPQDAALTLNCSGNVNINGSLSGARLNIANPVTLGEGGVLSSSFMLTNPLLFADGNIGGLIGYNTTDSYAEGSITITSDITTTDSSLITGSVTFGNIAVDPATTGTIIATSGVIITDPIVPPGWGTITLPPPSSDIVITPPNSTIEGGTIYVSGYTTITEMHSIPHPKKPVWAPMKAPKPPEWAIQEVEPLMHKIKSFIEDIINRKPACGGMNRR